MVRSVDSHPTVNSFLQIIRFVSLYARLNTVIKGSNIDNNEQMEILATTSKCLKHKAKQCDIDASDLKRALEDTLLNELTTRFVDSIPEPTTSDYIKDLLIYDICGFMLKARPCVTECIDCKKTVQSDELDLPLDFNAQHFTALRTRGGLIFVSVNMFKTFRVVESIIESHFNPIGQMYVAKSFEECIKKISQAQLMKLFCDAHRDKHLPYIIREYVCVRYHFESKRLKNLLLAQSDGDKIKKLKLSKHA